MISAASYGHSGFTSSAYYSLGQSNNFQKFTNGGVSEAAWMSGFTASPTTPSNLTIRAVNLYNQVSNVNRFSFYTSGIALVTARVIPQFAGGNADLSPTTVGWKLVA